MKKMSLALLAAASMGIAGMAQADAIFYPDGTMVELGESGADNLALDGSMRMDTTVLGAAPASRTTVTTVTPQFVYVQPNINWDRTMARTQMHSNVHLMNNGISHQQRTQAAGTFNVPARAGEASTMTGGNPNAVTDNNSFVVGSYSIPHSVLVTEPYYVFSY